MKRRNGYSCCDRTGVRKSACKTQEVEKFDPLFVNDNDEDFQGLSNVQ